MVSYRWRFEQHWPFWLFIFVLISPTVLYLASVVLSPRDLDSSTAPRNYRSHFYANHRTFFLLLAIYAPVDVADSWLKGTAHLPGLGASYFISATILFTTLIIAAFTRNERYHRVFAIYFLLHTSVISFAIFHTLV